MSVLRCDLPLDDYIVWRHPESSPGFGSQIIVSQSQQVALLASGELVAILDPGAHTLETANIPGIKNFLQSGVDSFPLIFGFSIKRHLLTLDGEPKPQCRSETSSLDF